MSTILKTEHIERQRTHLQRRKISAAIKVNAVQKLLDLDLILDL